MALLLHALAEHGQDAARAATEQLPEAVAAASLPVVDALLDAGADPRALDEAGMSVLRLAVRAGRKDTAARLTALGAVDDASDVDRFVGACLDADRDTVRRLLVEPSRPARPGDRCRTDRRSSWPPPRDVPTHSP